VRDSVGGRERQRDRETERRKGRNIYIFTERNIILGEDWVFVCLAFVVSYCIPLSLSVQARQLTSFKELLASVSSPINWE
jgi:hypothetical protein